MLPLLLRVDDLGSNRSVQHAFDRSPVRIGRNPLNDVVLDSSFVSQWHAMVRFDRDHTEYIDLGSTNGTLANGARVPRNAPIPVAGNVELAIGKLRLYCWRGPAPRHALGKPELPVSLGAPAQSIVAAERRTMGLRRGEKVVTEFPKAVAAVRELEPLYEDYRRAWKKLFEGCRHALAGLPGDLAGAMVLLMQGKMPAITGEDEFRALAREQEVSLDGQVGMGEASAVLVSEFARSLSPHLAVSSAAEVEAFLSRAASVMETFARAFVELRRGYEQFGSEMALRTGSSTPLGQAKTAKEVLQYLLDIRTDAAARIEELKGAFADIMIHQVALLSGMMEGVKTLLGRLAPEEIAAEVAHSPIQLGALKLPRAVWPFRTGARWRRFVTRHREFSEEESQVTAAVFGNEFAQAYSHVVGEEYSGRAPSKGAGAA